MALAAFALHLCVGLALASAMRLGYGRQWYAKPAGGVVVQAWMKGAARILRLRVTIHGRPEPGPTMIVANHISWLDIVAICTAQPTVFVAKHSIRQWPLVGTLAALAGTVFIERASRSALSGVVERVAGRLRDGCSVVVFPEATTTRGEAVASFNSALFQSAVVTGCMVQPVALRYPSVAARPSPAPFVDDDGFVSHLLRILRSEQVHVELSICRGISSPGAGRRQLSQTAHHHIARLVEDIPQADAA